MGRLPQLIASAGRESSAIPSPRLRTRKDYRHFWLNEMTLKGNDRKKILNKAITGASHAGAMLFPPLAIVKTAVPLNVVPERVVKPLKTVI